MNKKRLSTKEMILQAGDDDSPLASVATTAQQLGFTAVIKDETYVKFWKEMGPLFLDIEPPWGDTGSPSLLNIAFVHVETRRQYQRTYALQDAPQALEALVQAVEYAETNPRLSRKPEHYCKTVWDRWQKTARGSAWRERRPGWAEQ